MKVNVLLMESHFDLFLTLTNKFTSPIADKYHEGKLKRTLKNFIAPNYLIF